MKFTSSVRIKSDQGFYKIKPVNEADHELFRKLLGKRKDDNTPVGIELDLAERPRSFSQLKTVWALVGIIFQSDENRKGSAEELYELYENLLGVYADKVVNRLNGELRPVRISEGDVMSAAHFIEGLMLHLSEVCDLHMDAQTEVRGLLQQWEAFRGTLDDDPLDSVTEKDWRESHKYSEASGRGGQIERAHIVSRGADQGDIEAPWNWLALTPDEHRLQHAAGWEGFLGKFPHLTGRFERARRKAFQGESNG